MLELVKAFLLSQGWQYSQPDTKNTFLFGLTLEKGKFQCYLQVDEEEFSLSFYSFIGVNCPENKLIALSELLNRINYEVFLGNFEMDFTDGEIRFKTNLSFASITPSLPLIEELIFTNLNTIDKYYDSTLAVMFKEIDPSEAIKLVEI
ncbi:MAG: YbjN domain-containing protein [Cytophagales bacterium]